MTGQTRAGTAALALWYKAMVNFVWSSSVITAANPPPRNFR